MELTPDEKMDLTRHEEILAHLLEWADEELKNHPAAELCPRQEELLQRLCHAFADMQCPAAAKLLSAGLADDDWRAPRAVEYINATDATPRDNWQALSPLNSCEPARMGCFFWMLPPSATSCPPTCANTCYAPTTCAKTAYSFCSTTITTAKNCSLSLPSNAAWCRMCSWSTAAVSNR